MNLAPPPFPALHPRTHALKPLHLLRTPPRDPLPTFRRLPSNLQHQSWVLYMADWVDVFRDGGRNYFGGVL
jgi:hypothetical protein